MRLDAPDPVVARRQRHEVALVQIAAAQRFGEEGVDAGLAGALAVIVASPHQRATAPEAVHRSGRLVGIGPEGIHRQATRHVGFAVVVLGDGVEAVHRVELVGALDDHVIDARPAVLAIVGAAHTRVQDGATQPVVHRAPHTEVAGFLRRMLGGRGRIIHLQAGIHPEVFRNGAGHEVDDAAHVLRTIAHGATATHHVHGIHVAHRNRPQRQLRLAIGRVRHGNAVHQQRGAGGQARVQASNAEVQRHVVAAGAIVLGRIDTGDAIERLTDRGQPLLLQLLATHHITGTGMILHVLFVGITQPVTHHRHGGQRAGVGCIGCGIGNGVTGSGPGGRYLRHTTSGRLGSQHLRHTAAGGQQQRHGSHGTDHGMAQLRATARLRSSNGRQKT